MRGVVCLYGQIAVIIALCDTTAIVMNKYFSKKASHTTVLVDVVDVCVTALFWPVALPLQTLLAVDMYAYDATWTFTRKTNGSILEFGYKNKNV